MWVSFDGFVLQVDSFGWASFSDLPNNALLEIPECFKNDSGDKLIPEQSFNYRNWLLEQPNATP